MTCANKIRVKFIILVALLLMNTSVVSSNISLNEKHFLVDINLGYNKSAETNACPELTLMLKAQDIDND